MADVSEIQVPRPAEAMKAAAFDPPARDAVPAAECKQLAGGDRAQADVAAATAAEREAFAKEWQPSTLTASSADYYFDSYNHYGVHEDVLKDTVTTFAYQRAIKQNAHLFRGAVVLDVCAGLGMNSLFAAQAGAKKVIALESQPELVAMGRRVAEKNGYGAEVLEFVCGTASALEKLPGGLESVDIIVSEWMGYFLMYEARLADLLCARDKWLKPGGLIFPDRAKMQMALLEDAAYVERHFEFYNNVWGFDFSSMKDAAHSEPVVNLFQQAQLLTPAVCVLDLNLYSCKASDCFEMANSFQLVSKREGKAHALIFWFEMRFDSGHKPIFFTCGPESTPTCWKQTAFFLSGPPLKVKANDRVRGMVAVRKPDESKRSLDIKVSCRVNSAKPRQQIYRWS